MPKCLAIAKVLSDLLLLIATGDINLLSAAVRGYYNSRAQSRLDAPFSVRNGFGRF